MRKAIPTVLVALAGAFMVSGVAQAQTCGMLADPNSPACKGGTAAPTALASPGTPATQAGVSSTPLDKRQAPGMGQKVCAFFDTKTNRCLTVRPDTQAYDNAVQTGIEAAMMGMQIQQDAIYRAGQMGVLSGFGRGDAATAGVGLPQMPTGAVAAPPGLAMPGAAPAEQPSARQASGTSLVACTRQRITQTERAAGRPATAEEVTAAMRSCDTP